MDKFLENRQNYKMDNNSMQHMNVASADCDAVVGALQAEVVSAGVGGVTSEILGGKYDEHQEEHDVGDDDELKYVKEVQQSEKQQPQLQTLKNFSLEDDDGTYECNELAEKETTNNATHEFGNGGFVFGGDHQQQPQQHRDLFNMGNGHDTNGHDNVNNEEFGNLVSTEFEDKLNVMKSEIDDFVPQVDVKIETKDENQVEMIDEEEPSSLATNTTNGTSSLSENVPPQAVVAPLTNIFDDFMGNLENKENSDPLTPQRPNELDLEQAHSQLNPDAKEFVPSFGSNPASPTSPFATGDIMETQIFGQAPSVVPRHLLGDDDFVAQSPRKGKDDNNMDTVSLPKELSEFEQEADKRPHELEPQDIDGFHQRDEVMTPDQATPQLPLDDVVIQDKENEHLIDSTDFQPSNFMDHGPETCVDLDADLDVQPAAVSSSLQHDDDVMKRSMYVATDDAIEDVLNSVQPIPTEIDSVNNSFIEESATESAANQLAGDKELLQIEEKENVSHSPSTEEIQMNLQNTLNCSNKDISQLPIDLDNETNMQESMYVEQESMYLEQEAQLELDEEDDKQFRVKEQPFKHEQMSNEQPQIAEQHLQETTHHEEQQEQIELEEDIQSEMDQIPLQQDFIVEQGQNKDETHNFLEELITQKQPEEAQHDLQKEEQEHFKNPIESESHQDQQLSEPLSLEQHEEIHDLDQQPTQDLMADTSTYLAEDSLLADTTNPLITNDSFLYNSPATQEQQQEIHESFSPFKISDEVSNAPAAMESLHFDEPESQQESNLITTTSYTADEKHLLEETKEQPLFSMSGLDQQMGEMMINNTDGHLSQAEKVAATTAVTAIEDISEQLITPDEAVASEEQYDHHHRQELEQSQDQMFADDSFFQNEQKYLKQYQQEQEDNKEMEIVKQEQIDPETKNVLESIESPIQQQHQLEFESEMVAVEEPIIEAKQTAPLFTTNEETEILNETKINENICNMEEIPPSMVPETASAELLEQQPITAVKQNETDIVKNGLEEEPALEAVEEIKTEITEKIPELEELNTNEEDCAKEVVATPEVKPDIPVEAAVGAATVVAASIAAVAAKVASAPSNNKAETAKKPLSKTTTTAAKTKVGSAPSAKKPIEATKKPVGLAAKPRAAPAKPASTTADKKPIAKTTSTTATTAARKPLSASTTATSKVVAKNTTPTSTTRTVTAASKTTTTSRPTTAPRTTTTTTTAARKPTTSTNGPLAKPRPATAPAKPTTLGLSATNGAPKTKPTSPRSTLSSQVRKTASAPTAAKSPVKSTATNGVNKTASTLATRTKTTASTVSSTAGTAGKTFTARPAPKFNSSSNTTTTTTSTKRLTTGGITTSSTTTSNISSSPMRKSSPTKHLAGRTPFKSTTTAGSLKSKAPATKTSSATPPSKPAPIRKPVDKTAAVINGDVNANKDLNGTVEKIAAPAEDQKQQAIPHNGDLQAVQQNGDTNIPMQTEEQQQQSYLESRNEQIPMDLINA